MSGGKKRRALGEQPLIQRMLEKTSSGYRSTLGRTVYRNVDVVYVILLAIVLRIVPVDEIVRSFLALPVFVTIPCRFGNSLLSLSRSLFKNVFDFNLKFDSISRVILLWCFGTVTIVSLAMMLSFYDTFLMSSFLAILFTVIIFGIVVDIVRNNNSKEVKKLRLVPKELLVVIFLVATSLIPLVYFMSGTVFPLPVGGTDFFPHVLRMSQVVEEDYLSPYWFGVNYPPTLQVLFSVPCILFNVNPLSLLWSVPFLFYPLYGVGIYLFSYQLSNRKVLSLLAAIIGVYATGYPKWVFLNSLYYCIPKNAIYLLVPFFLFVVTRNLSVGNPRREAFLVVRNPSDGNLRKDIAAFSLIATSSLLIFSVLSLTMSLADHKLPLVFIVFVLVFPLFSMLKRFRIHVLLLIDVVFLISFLSVFSVMSPGELPVERIVMGLCLATVFVPFLLFFKNSIAPKSFLVFSTITLGALFLHLLMGLLLVFIILLYVIGQICVKRRFAVVPAFLIIFASVMILFEVEYIISLNRISDFFSPLSWALGGRMFDFSAKYEILMNTYSITTLILTFVGIVAMVVLDKTRFLHILMVFSALVALYFFPASGLWRTITYITPFLSFLAAYSLTLPQKLMAKLKKSHMEFGRMNTLYSSTRFNKTMILGNIVLASLLLTPNIILPHRESFQVINSWSAYSSYLSIISYSDIHAAAWIRENTPKDVILISEDVSRRMFSSLANREEGFDMLALPELRYQIREILETSDASEAYSMIMKLREQVLDYDRNQALRGFRFLEGDRPVIVVVNGATSRVVNTPNATIGPGVPVPFELFEGFSKFFNTTYFVPLHNVGRELFIFGVRIDDSFSNYSLQREVMSDCDSTTNWVTAPDRSEILLDTQDKKVGLASIRLKTVNLIAGGWYGMSLDIEPEQNWSSEQYLFLGIKVADVVPFSNLYVILGNNSSNGYQFEILKTLSSGVWSQLVIPLSLMDAFGTSPSLSSTRSISISFQLTASPLNADLWVDDIAVGQVVKQE